MKTRPLLPVSGRIAILNRGEPAVRFLRALREYNLERETSLKAIACWTDPDKDAPFVHLADEDIHLGPPTLADASGAIVSAYCHHTHVIRALQQAQCDAVWPGWGFVSEDPVFVAMLEDAGMTFLGPSSEAMERLGDKIASKQLAEQHGVPLAPWHLIQPNDREEDLQKAATRIGFPLMVKASAGGGGRGIRKVRSASELLTSIASVQDEVRKVFGQGGVFMEACIQQARHIEVQFVADIEGNTITLGVRDCSIQRRNQKVIEEAPSPILPPEQEQRLCAATKRLVEASGYQGVGTAEYLYQPSTQASTFLEVNSRLQVEHTVTESIMGIDLVKAQIDIARQLDWSQEQGWDFSQATETTPLPRHGHAIEVRLNAENPEQGFQPSPGHLRVFQIPSGPGIRIDSGVREGMSIAPHFDSMIAKVIAWAPTRRQAVARLLRVLREFPVVVEDGATNKAFLLELLQHPQFLEGKADTYWLDRAMEEGTLGSQDGALEALLVAAILEAKLHWRNNVQRFFAQAQDGIPQHNPTPKGFDVRLQLRGQRYQVRIFMHDEYQYQVQINQAIYPVTLEPIDAHSGLLQCGNHQYHVLHSHGRNGISVEVDGTMHTVERATGGVVKAPAPAVVVHVAVEEGQEVQPGELLCTLEVMKMEMLVRAQEAGIVRSTLCRPNQQVNAGQPLVVLQSEASDSQHRQDSQLLQAPPNRLHFFAQQAPPSRLETLSNSESTEQIERLTHAIRSILLGFDVAPDDLQLLERLFESQTSFAELRHPERWLPLVSLLDAFVDIEALFEQNLLLLTEEAAAESAERSFYEFCRRHHEGKDGLEPRFAPLLERALRWYSITDLTPTHELRDALCRMVVAHTNPSTRHRLLSSLLRLMMELSQAGLSSESFEPWNRTLERVAMLAHHEHPYVADNARQARYVLFERPQYVQRRQVVEQLLSDELQKLRAALAQNDDITEQLNTIVQTRHSMLPLLLRMGQPDSLEAAALAEIVLRRLYVGTRYQRCNPALHQNDSSASEIRTISAMVPTTSSTTLFSLSALQQGASEAREVPQQRLSPTSLTLPESLPSSLHLFEIEQWPRTTLVIVALGLSSKLSAILQDLQTSLPHIQTNHAIRVELALFGEPEPTGISEALLHTIQSTQLPASLEQFTVTWNHGTERLHHRTFQPSIAPNASIDANSSSILAWKENHVLQDVHVEAAKRIELERLQEFHLERLPTLEQIYAFRGQAKDNPKDTRIFVFAEVYDVPEYPQIDTHDERLFEFEQMYYEGLRILRELQSKQKTGKRFHWNQFTLFVRPTLRMGLQDLMRLAKRFESPTRGLGLQRVSIRANIAEPMQNKTRPMEFLVHKRGRHRLEIHPTPPSQEPIKAMTPYDLKVVRARQRGTLYPYELISMLEGRQVNGLQPHPDMTQGRFEEYDLDSTQTRLEPVYRPPGENKAGVVVGILSNRTAKYPEGMRRVWMASDPTRAMGALAEPECRRVLAAIDLAQQQDLPIEWLPISAGARISMESGTENLDWTARVLRRIVEFTQGGGLIHLIITDVNVGAQSYWNAEATMLMHTRGALIMTPKASMVLTGKKALEYSGGVAAENERCIGGFERIMGPNGQAQYFAKDLGEAYAILFEHYRFSYRAPGETRPRSFPTQDNETRSILQSPYHAHHGESFATIGEIFDPAHNPGRKKPFAIREVMSAVIDQDGGSLERYRSMRHADTAVVWDAHLGGYPITLIGFESRPQVRRGRIPMDGPEMWTGGTLFPQSSKKVAFAINAASESRPVVILANLSGFDGSPESLRKLQLEMGAEIGRAIVNFQGPIVFVVIGRYHGGAYVVFSKALNPNLTALALEGTYASVIGGAPAAAVVFPHEVRRRANLDPRIQKARRKLDEAPSTQKPQLREEFDDIYADVFLEKQGEVAQEFDAIHTVERAVQQGSLDAIIAPNELRPAIIQTLHNQLSLPHPTRTRSERDPFLLPNS